ncbi:carboxymuconolactone decarboxylase family protein [Flammeovirga pectinis]|uniref:Carboxymuconolactone decarboxylase family protein n=1 Tax=Flammeovirga pectinis TaxID=2494373 RepID=A0A3S9P7A1_9BACT|nr:carboxymuconolactone decarboxylase family protein [Flammeovirga pectinis]AZQ64067.1 carboxymuconolactone decarboxylase family protein [Flammeovirga pectinis]
MKNFTIHTLESAPKESQPFLEEKVKAYGYLPNLTATLAESPELLEAYLMLHDFFVKTSFDKDELTVVWQAINVENDCHYCVPAHTAIANMMKVDPAITQALRDQTPLPTEKLEALRTFSLAMVRERGFVSDEELEAFYSVGYTHKNVLEVILGLAQKTISNYTNHVAKTPLDKVHSKYAWNKETIAE